MYLGSDYSLAAKAGKGLAGVAPGVTSPVARKAPFLLPPKFAAS
ncbi:hypothetical protein COCCU_01690 [Corynebacterium occultum]|uniref:Uncharacterized protein n=1 Tax=Corynebacterium occultum TaxID=2675219 RepID=A0A6B8WIJ1_9CORY|nr:hypothetical protein COCCU_01690 [Corynebacterium occultum]